MSLADGEAVTGVSTEDEEVVWKADAGEIGEFEVAIVLWGMATEAATVAALIQAIFLFNESIEEVDASILVATYSLFTYMSSENSEFWGWPGTDNDAEDGVAAFVIYKGSIIWAEEEVDVTMGEVIEVVSADVEDREEVGVPVAAEGEETVFIIEDWIGCIIGEGDTSLEVNELGS